MASKAKDIIEIGEGWECALRTEEEIPAIHCFYQSQLVSKLPISIIVQCTPFNHTIQQEAKTSPTEPFSIIKVPEPKSIIRAATVINGLIRKSTQQTNAYIISTQSNACSLVISVGGNSRHVYENNMVATAEASQNMASTGASPVAFFKLPLYSEQCHQPTLGLVGLLPKEAPRTTLSFSQKGDMIYLLGRSVEDIASSEYLYSFHHIHPSPAPWMNPQEQSRLHSMLSEAINKNLITSINSVSKGGMFISLVESSLHNQLGFDITTDAEIREDAFLFGESLGRFIVSTSEKTDAAFVDLMIQNNIPVTTLGHTTKGEIRIDDISYGFIQDYE